MSALPPKADVRDDVIQARYAEAELLYQRALKRQMYLIEWLGE